MGLLDAQRATLDQNYQSKVRMALVISARDWIARRNMDSPKNAPAAQILASPTGSPLFDSFLWTASSYPVIFNTVDSAGQVKASDSDIQGALGAAWEVLYPDPSLESGGAP